MRWTSTDAEQDLRQNHSHRLGATQRNGKGARKHVCSKR